MSRAHTTLPLQIEEIEGIFKIRGVSFAEDLPVLYITVNNNDIAAKVIDKSLIKRFNEKPYDFLKSNYIKGKILKVGHLGVIERGKLI